MISRGVAAIPCVVAPSSRCRRARAGHALVQCRRRATGGRAGDGRRGRGRRRDARAGPGDDGARRAPTAARRRRRGATGSRRAARRGRATRGSASGRCGSPACRSRGRSSASRRPGPSSVAYLAKNASGITAASSWRASASASISPTEKSVLGIAERDHQPRVRAQVADLDRVGLGEHDAAPRRPTRTRSGRGAGVPSGRTVDSHTTRSLVEHRPHAAPPSAPASGRSPGARAARRRRRSVAAWRRSERRDELACREQDRRRRLDRPIDPTARASIAHGQTSMPRVGGSAPLDLRPPPRSAPVPRRRRRSPRRPPALRRRARPRALARSSAQSQVLSWRSRLPAGEVEVDRRDRDRAG